MNHLSGSIEGSIHQFLIQVLGVGIAIAYSFVLTYVLPWLVNLITRVRVSEQIEVAGSDNGLFGEEASVE